MSETVSPYFRLRLPMEVKAWLAARAKANHRSINAEIVFRLEQERSGESNPTAGEVSQA